ncbi:MAG: hypothetical protein HQL32_16975, partial [Planctomycetes bacterium]|nr:hypothetical protein [Planctomycetota bacterium]
MKKKKKLFSFGNGDNSQFICLTDLSLTTLMIFVTFTLTILICVHSSADSNVLKDIEKLNDSRNEYGHLIEVLENIQSTSYEEELKNRSLLYQSADPNKDFFTSFAPESDEAKMQSEALQNLQATLEEVRQQEKFFISTTDSEPPISDEAILSKTLSRMESKLKQQLESETQDIIRHNQYLNRHHLKPTWTIYFLKNGDILKASFSADPKRTYSLDELGAILECIKRGDGIRIKAHGYEALDLMDQCRVDDLFTQAGWPLQCLQFKRPE